MHLRVCQIYCADRNCNGFPRPFIVLEWRKSRDKIFSLLILEWDWDASFSHVDLNKIMRNHILVHLEDIMALHIS